MVFRSNVLQYGGEIRCKGYMSATTRCTFSFVTFDILRPDEKPDNSSTGVSADDLKRKELFVLPVCLKFVSFTDTYLNSLRIPDDEPSSQLGLSMLCLPLRPA